MDHPVPPESRPTPAQAREAVQRLFGLTNERYDALEAAYLRGRIADTPAWEWLYDPKA